MKNILTTKNKKIFITTFIIFFLVHLPLITKNIISADILLNNYWSISYWYNKKLFNNTPYRYNTKLYNYFYKYNYYIRFI